ncbi:type 4a pilus biogenesis protein PilO [Paenibacillus typhae]|uniref:type 4a pilus biogenesis protein PilO n=1 Tax=Paenibacillus typhae TaxID=1174501 RepID=UPI001C8E0E59|nr:type 4a pilus biogenesis protein PilO [Paenibacillus typhae]MBY0009490.1 type 4a pilus biogenesis protein PilO [Paenibacillus typhae]
MEQINKYRSPIVMGMLILFLILFAFYMLAIRPVSSDIAVQSSELSMLELERSAIENKINELKGAGDSLSADEETALAAIPSGDGSEALINDLKAIGASSHARLKDIGFSLTDTSTASDWAGVAAASAAGLQEIKMTAIIEGGYAEIHEWLKQLNKMPRLVTVDSFAFQQPYEFPTAQNPGSILTANVAFTAYYQADSPK